MAVLGLAASSQSALLAEIRALGTNLLTVSNGQAYTGQTAELPAAAPGMIARLPGVTGVQDTGAVTGVNAYKSRYVPVIETNGLSVDAATLGLPAVVGTSLAQGRFLNAATAREPVAVLGAEAALLMGIDRISPGERIWLCASGTCPAGGQWFYVTGILSPIPATYALEINTPVLIGFPAAEQYLGLDGHPSEIYVRTINTLAATAREHSLLAAQADPENPGQANVSQPSNALTAQADAKGALDTLFLGLGAVALLVGAIGVASIMVISVLERRSEIGLRRARRRPRPDPHPVPSRGHLAVPGRRCRRSYHRRDRHRRLRQQPRRALDRARVRADGRGSSCQTEKSWQQRSGPHHRCLSTPSVNIR